MALTLTLGGLGALLMGVVGSWGSDEVVAASRAGAGGADRRHAALSPELQRGANPHASSVARDGSEGAAEGGKAARAGDGSAPDARRVAPADSGSLPDDHGRDSGSPRSGGTVYGFDFLVRGGSDGSDSPSDGRFIQRYADGSIAVDGSMENGERHGEWSGYHADGSLRLEGQYSEGKRVGRWKAYHPSGQLLGEGEFEAGLREGAWTLYYSNGLVKEHGFFAHDLLHGPWLFYDEFGQPEPRSGYYRYGRRVDS